MLLGDVQDRRIRNCLALVLAGVVVLSKELVLVEDTGREAVEAPALDVSVFEDDAMTLARAVREACWRAWELDISRHVYVIAYLDADMRVIFKHEIDYDKFEDMRFARQYINT